MKAARPAGFTLLEVLVAIAILGLGLTAILSAQTGLFASSSYAERVSLATGLIRCKMSEIELKLDREGYPFTDLEDQGACCADEPSGPFTCKWKVQKIQLPPPPQNTLGGGLGGKSLFGGSGSSGSLGSAGGGLGSAGGLGAIGAMFAMGASGGTMLGNNAGLGDVAKAFTTGAPPGALGGQGSGFSGLDTLPAGSGSAGAPPPPPTDSPPANPMSATGALAPLVMGLVYPSLKPMLEMSIRKLTVAVHWKEGSKDRDLTVQQFVTNPVAGGLDPNAAKGLEGLSGLITGQGQSPTPTPTGTP